MHVHIYTMLMIHALLHTSRIEQGDVELAAPPVPAPLMASTVTLYSVHCVSDDVVVAQCVVLGASLMMLPLALLILTL